MVSTERKSCQSQWSRSPSTQSCLYLSSMFSKEKSSCQYWNSVNSTQGREVFLKRYLVCRSRCSLRVKTMRQSPKPVHWKSLVFGFSRCVFFATGMGEKDKVKKGWKKKKKCSCAWNQTFFSTFEFNSGTASFLRNEGTSSWSWRLGAFWAISTHFHMCFLLLSKEHAIHTWKYLQDEETCMFVGFFVCLIIAQRTADVFASSAPKSGDKPSLDCSGTVWSNKTFSTPGSSILVMVCCCNF